jgi:ribosomal protein S18 acetylase RimI-like enzyme
MEIIKANLQNLSDVARLFDLYRQFYECPPDFKLATSFIKERIVNSESDIFLATDGNSACGFVQLYPSFCSVQAIKIYILYDLYVEADHRNAGVGESLMNRATEWAKENNAARLDLLTAHTNKIGQHLYEKIGYKRVLDDFHAYSLELQ